MKNPRRRFRPACVVGIGRRNPASRCFLGAAPGLHATGVLSPPATNPCDAASRVAALAHLARSRQLESVTDHARRVTIVADLARVWLEGSASQVRAELTERLAAAERIGFIPSMFEIMGRPWLERPFNSVLAWIADPAAEHGVGSAVLRELSTLLAVPELANDVFLDATTVCVHGEEPWPPDADGEGEPDLLTIAPSIVVLIENKVRAGESGEDQYPKYLRSLKRLAERRARPYAAFLLAPQVREPPVCGEESWSPSKTHAELAQALRNVAAAATTSHWGRVLCLLVAQELSPNEAGVRHLNRARALLKTTGASGVRHLAEMRHLAATLSAQPTPWHEATR